MHKGSMAENDAVAKNRPHTQRKRPGTHLVAMLAYPDAQILDITGPLEVFARTARWLQEHERVRYLAYEIQLLAPSAGPVVTSGGLALLAESSYRHAKPADTLLISGGVGYVAAIQNTAMLDWIRLQAQRVDRIGSTARGPCCWPPLASSMASPSPHTGPTARGLRPSRRGHESIPMHCMFAPGASTRPRV